MSIMLTNKANYPMSILYTKYYEKVPKSDRGNKHILTCRDNFTRLDWCTPVTDKESKTVVQALEGNDFKYFGLVDAIISSNARSVLTCLGHHLRDLIEIEYCRQKGSSVLLKSGPIRTCA